MSKFSQLLINWYQQKDVKLPWRGETDIYKIWLSEVMLQQTQVKTVKPYYMKWLKQLPTCELVANSTEDEVLKLWEGLGYYARARNFKAGRRS